MKNNIEYEWYFYLYFIFNIYLIINRLKKLQLFQNKNLNSILDSLIKKKLEDSKNNFSYLMKVLWIN